MRYTGSERDTGWITAAPPGQGAAKKLLLLGGEGVRGLLSCSGCSSPNMLGGMTARGHRLRRAESSGDN